jgi:hypothetical protein
LDTRLVASSSVLISSPVCRVEPKQFVKLVENGAIRVIGREKWITSRVFRNYKHRWDGARWVPEIDEALKSIATDDQSAPLTERRVVLAEDEKGARWAKEHIEKNPELVESIYLAISATDAKDHFPPGVIDASLADANDPKEIVQNVVRSAYNHDAAIAQSGTRTPFLLAPKEAGFNQLLESVRAATDVEFPTGPDKIDDFDLTAFAELTSEVLKVLEHIEKSHRPKIDGFVASEGHALLADWMKRTVESLVRTKAGDVRGEVIARLRAEFDSGKLQDDWRDIFLKTESLIGSAGTGLSMVDLLVNELEIYGALGLAAGAYAISYGLAQKFGFAAIGYGGPQWAFIYAFGRRASARRKARLQQTLDLLGPE